MKQLYEKICTVLLEQNTENVEKNLYEYAIKIVFNFVFNIIISIIMAHMFDKVRECIIMLISFFAIRKFTGGLHLKNKIICQVCSLSLILIFLIYITYFSYMINSHLIIIISLVSIIIIFFFSPLENNNKPLLKKEKNIYKIVSLAISIMLLVIILVLKKTNLMIMKSVFIGLFFDSVLLLAGTINKFVQKHML